MIQRKKSLATYCREKKLREGKPLFPSKTPAVTSDHRPATSSRKGAQGQQEPRPARRAGLKPVSSKRAKENRIYTERRRLFLMDHPWCAVNPLTPAIDVHHVRGRGKLFLDERYWLAVSREGHEWIHRNPNRARELGFVAPRGA